MRVRTRARAVGVAVMAPAPARSGGAGRAPELGLENVMGIVKDRRLSAPSTGQRADSPAWDMGRETSNSRPHCVQRKSYRAMTLLGRMR